MKIEKLEKRALTAAISGLNKAGDINHVQSVLVSIIFCTLNGNTDPLNKAMNKGDNNLSGVVRGYLNKWAGKAVSKQKDKSYKQDTQKRRELLASMDLEEENFTFEQLAEFLPHHSPKLTAKEATPYDALKAAKNLIKRIDNAMEADGSGVLDVETAIQVKNALTAFNI